MSNFKRVSLSGSEELFRPTSRPTVVRESEEIIAEVITEVLDHPPVPHHLRHIELTAEELDLVLEAVQCLKYPDKIRPKPSLEKFERLDHLREKLQTSL
ncbi:MAG TPA: hypothetical protein VG015_05280 [Candidatus Dormibacteraeota bacterium]|nr:hypothetical protein [Candidatus Dormibacteraeota bacterium]